MDTTANDRAAIFKEETLQVKKFSSLLSQANTPYIAIHKWK